MIRYGMAIVALVVVACVAAACGQAGSTPTPRGAPTEAPTPRAPDLPVSTPPPVAGVPPAILDAARVEAARLSGLPVEQLVVVRAEPVTWSDGSMGCPQPGQLYTQAVVDGYWIIIGAGPREYDFRISENASIRLCEPTEPPRDSPVTPGT